MSVLASVEPVTPASPPSGPDPHLLPEYLLEVAGTRGHEVVEVSCTAPTWSLRYTLVLMPFEGRWLARTPEFGGAFLDGDVSSSTAAQARAAVDDALRGAGVISEVMLTSPWLPHTPELTTAWGLRPTKPVCLVGLPLDPLRLGHGRRDDLRRSPVEAEVGPLEAAGASRFAARYADAMRRVGAEGRWLFDEAYFAALARSGCVLLSEAEGAMALFLHGGTHGVYLLSARWGSAPGASSRVLWSASCHLSENGCDELLLGGGVSSSDDDPLLRFKRSWGGREVMQLLGARCFDLPAQEAAQAAGARPLPEWWVAA